MKDLNLERTKQIIDEEVEKMLKLKELNHKKNLLEQELLSIISESDENAQYEQIVFMQDSEAYKPMDILKDEGPDAAMQYLMQWHYPGQHMLQKGTGKGTADKTYEKDNYVLIWNPYIEYIGLVHKVDDETLNENDQNLPRRKRGFEVSIDGMKQFVRQANRQDLDRNGVDRVLKHANAVFGGYGVEAVTDENAYINKYYQNAIALYVNKGDTFDTTILYDTKKEKFLVISWGNFYEYWQRKNPIDETEVPLDEYHMHDEDGNEYPTDIINPSTSDAWSLGVKNTKTFDVSSELPVSYTQGQKIYLKCCANCNDVTKLNFTNERQYIGNAYQTLCTCDNCNNYVVFDDNKYNDYKNYLKIKKNITLDLNEYDFEDEGPQPGDAEYHYPGPENRNQGIGSFTNIDWMVFYEQLIDNQKALVNGGTLPGNNRYYPSSISDLTDRDEGMFSPQELGLLFDADIITTEGPMKTVVLTPEYIDQDVFYRAVKDVWNKALNNKPKISHPGNDSEAPYMRGHETDGG